MGFACPLCSQPLVAEGNALRCSGGHSYDLSKYGYVNLLMSQKSSKKRHGDDLAMLRARRDFLSGGYYDCLIQAVRRRVLDLAGEGSVLLDVGCGECTYTADVYNALTERFGKAEVMGIDISRDALRLGHSICQGLELAVAGASKLPLREGSVDIVMNFFAPCDEAEVFRVLRPGGYLVRVSPLPGHLMSLKRAVYDRPRENKPDTFEPEKLEETISQTIENRVAIDSQKAIADLFMMTPYYYKTGVEDQKKLLGLTSLTVEIECRLRVYKKYDTEG